MVKKELNSINDLRNIDFGRSVPKHSLLLLHWFANTINIDSQNNIWLTFDPNTNYGSHHYGNFDGLLEPLPRGHQYFTVGNLNRDTSEELPNYVVNPIEEFDGRNSDRIIFSVRQQNTGWRRIDRVYLTQHKGALDSKYDQDHTYEVTTNLLREIRQLGVRSLEDLTDHFGDSVNELNNIRSRGGQLASLGLLFIVLQIRNYSPPTNYRDQPAVRSNTQSNGRIDRVYLTQHKGALESPYNPDHTYEVTTNLLREIREFGVEQDRRSLGDLARRFGSNANERQLNDIRNTWGSGSGTNIPQIRQNPQHDGLIACIAVFIFIFILLFLAFLAQFKNPQTVLITGYNAHLQVFVKDGKACARLYVGKSFGEWKSEFKKSWIGFYTSEDKATNDYEWWQWQWATKLKPSTDYDNAYEYHSDMAIAPGVQARFILWDDEVRARTPSWT